MARYWVTKLYYAGLCLPICASEHNPKGHWGNAGSAHLWFRAIMMMLLMLMIMITI